MTFKVGKIYVYDTSTVSRSDEEYILVVSHYKDDDVYKYVLIGKPDIEYRINGYRARRLWKEIDEDTRGQNLLREVVK